jgi:hypothetical protein
MELDFEAQEKVTLEVQEDQKYSRTGIGESVGSIMKH